MPHLRIKTVGALALGSIIAATSVVAAQDDATAGASVVPPGPMGRSISDWHAEYVGSWRSSFESWLDEGGEGPLDCALGDRGDVFFVPNFGGQWSCEVGADQHLLLVLPGNVICSSEESMVSRWEDAKGDKRTRRRLEERIQAERALAWVCLADSRRGFGRVDGPAVERRNEIADPALTIDGVVIPIDERDFDISTPVSISERADAAGGSTFAGSFRDLFASAGWVVMLEPLAPGSHVIDASASVLEPGEEPRSERATIDVEVVPTASE